MAVVANRSCYVCSPSALCALLLPLSVSSAQSGGKFLFPPEHIHPASRLRTRTRHFPRIQFSYALRSPMARARNSPQKLKQYSKHHMLRHNKLTDSYIIQRHDHPARLRSLKLPSNGDATKSPLPSQPRAIKFSTEAETFLNLKNAAPQQHAAIIQRYNKRARLPALVLKSRSSSRCTRAQIEGRYYKIAISEATAGNKIQQGS